MTDQWYDDSISSAQVKGDDDEVPDDWEDVLEEKFVHLIFLNIYRYFLLA